MINKTTTSEFRYSVGKANRFVKRLVGRWRVVWLWLQGADVSFTVRLYGPISIIEDVRRLKIGEKTKINGGVHLNLSDKISIGSDCHISTQVQIHTSVLTLGINKLHVARPVVINDGVWIASGVVISAGVTIGENSIVGANSLVLNDIPKNVFAVGNPCRVIFQLDEKKNDC